jgi:hypothetical protein
VCEALHERESGKELCKYSASYSYYDGATDNGKRHISPLPKSLVGSLMPVELCKAS